MRTLTLVLVSASLVSLPAKGSAQALRSLGLAIGRMDSRQLRARSPDSGTRQAVAVGLRAQVDTPRSWLDVGVGLTYSPRGGEYTLSTPSGSGPLQGAVHADYVTFSVLPTARLPLGPLNLCLFAGPAVDVHVRGKAATELAPEFRDPNPQVAVAVAGFGVDVTGPGRVVLGIDIRFEEGLGGAYRNLSEQLRHRSRSTSLWLGFRPVP